MSRDKFDHIYEQVERSEKLLEKINADIAKMQRSLKKGNSALHIKTTRRKRK